MALSKLGEDLDANGIAKIVRKPGKHPDGGGLYLQVASPGQGSWVVRFGTRWKSLGPVDEISAEDARARRKAMWVIHRAGGDPFAVADEAKRERAAEKAAEAARVPFGDLVEPFLALNAPSWSGGVEGDEASKYRKTLIARGSLSRVSVGDITSADVEKHLTHFPAASGDKVRMRVMQLISYAVARGLRPDGPNPARKEVMKHLVASAPKSTPHKAMPLADVPGLMGELIVEGSPAARALGFLILTAARTGEAIKADWSEIDGNVWTVPASRMKEGKEHSVPLSSAALALLGEPKKSGLIFGKLAHDALIDRLKVSSTATVHGFRSVFTGFAAKAGYPKELRDRALAHAVGNATAQAYDRERLTEERRPLMNAWAEFCLSR